MKRLFQFVDLLSLFNTNSNKAGKCNDNKIRRGRRQVDFKRSGCGRWHCLRLEELEDRRLLATTWYVNTTADVAENSWSTTDSTVTLREAIGRASAGDTIRFDSSLRGQTIALDGTALTVKKAMTIDAASLWNSSSSSPGLTINAQKLSGVFSVNDGKTSASIYVTMTGLAITGGNAKNGGGIYCYRESLTLNDCVIYSNDASGAGGGIWIDYGSLTMTNCTIKGNYSANEGGGIYSNGCTQILTNCAISGNKSNSVYGSARSGGGGVRSVSGTLTMTNCTIKDNSSTVEGGGIQSSSTMILKKCTISGNTASRYGGGIYSNSTQTLTDCTISGNTSSLSGGGIYAGGTQTLTNCVVTNNTSSGGGGGMYTNSGTHTLVNCLFGGNTGSSGGGIYSDSGSVTMTNCTIGGNTASAGNGGGIYIYGGTRTLKNCIIAENKASGQEKDIFRANVSSAVIQGHNNLSSYTAWAGDSGSNYTYNADLPLFIDRIYGNYQLATESQAIDKGNNDYVVDIKTDLVGSVRVYNGTVDLGAYEKTSNLTSDDVGDTFSIAKSLPFSYNVASHTEKIGNGLYTTKDLDVYCFSVATADIGKSYTFETSLPSGGTALNSYIRLYSPSKSMIGSDDDSGTGNYSKLTWTASSTGTFYLVVSSYGNRSADPSSTSGRTASTTGDYTLTITRMTNVVTNDLSEITLSNTIPKVGSNITTTLSPTGATATYQWYRGTSTSSMTAISGATSSNYVPNSSDVGYYLKVIATGSGSYTGTVQAISSTKVSSTVSNTLSSITLSTNSPQTGAVISTTLSPTGATATYQWYRGTSTTSMSTIYGATGAAYVPVAADVGCYLKVIATGNGNYTGTVQTISSMNVSTTTSDTLNSITLSTNSPQAGNTISTTLSPSGGTANYQWYRGTSTSSMTVISGAFGSSYTPGASDVGYYLKVIATGIGNYSGTVWATTSSPVKNSIDSIALSTQTPVAGERITTSLSPANATVTYQWYRGTSTSSMSIISGATNTSYTPVSSDVGYYLKVIATGTGVYNGSAFDVTASPVGTGLSSITLSTGTPEIGSVITTTLSPSTGTASYQWYRGTNRYNISQAITNANRSTYTVTTADQGCYLKVVATGIGNYRGEVYATTTGIVPYSGNTTIIVDTENDVVSTSDGLMSLREAIDKVATGEYGTTIAFAPSLQGKTISLNGSPLSITKSMTIDATSLWDSVNNKPGITINANNLSNVFNITDGSDWLKIDVALIGLTISGGKTTNGPGAGIYCYEDNLALTNCFIHDNSSSGFGGGLYLYGGTHSLTNCTISGNLAQSSGGGLYAFDSEMSMTNCDINSNSATSGGGLYISGGTQTLSNCIVNNNLATTSGGGLYASGGVQTLVNIALIDNACSSNGGGLYSSNGTQTLTNCTIGGNVATRYGGGIYAASGTRTLYNNIVAANRADTDGSDIYKTSSSSYVVQGFNNISSYLNWNGNSGNNLFYDTNLPLFADTEQKDYRLASESQAIDKGNNSYAVDLIFDLAGNARIGNGKVDLGAYEYVSGLPLANITLSTTSPRVETTIVSTLSPMDATAVYRWYRGTDLANITTMISGATGSNYTVTEADQGCYLKVVATGTGEYSGSVAATTLTVVPTNNAKINASVVFCSSLSNSDVSISLPNQIDSIQRGKTVFAEIWLQNKNAGDPEIVAGSFDLNYNSTVINAVSLGHGNRFTTLVSGTLDNSQGLINDLGGGTLSPGTINGQWVRLGYVEFTTVEEGNLILSLAPGNMNVAQVGSGNIDWDSIVMSNATLLVESACVYDIDQSGRIDFGDFSYFAAAFGSKKGDTLWNAKCDFNRDNQIDFGDFSFFVSAFGKNADDTTIVYPNTGSGICVPEWNAELSEAAAALLPGLAEEPLATKGQNTIEVQPIVRIGTGGSSTVVDLPQSETSVGLNETCYIDIYVKSTDSDCAGITAGSVDISYNPQILQAESLSHGNVYNVSGLTFGQIDNVTGLVDDFGGGTFEAGKSTQYWELLGSVIMESLTSGTCTLDLEPGSFNFAEYGAGNIDWNLTTLHDLVINVGVRPDLLFDQTEYTVQEGCSVFLNIDQVENNLTYWWDLSGTGNGEFVQKDESFWFSTDNLAPGEYVLRLRVQNEQGIDSLPVSVSLTILETPPCIEVEKTSLLNEQIVKLNLNAHFNDGRSVQRWVINWGDGSEPMDLALLSNSVTVAHYYPQSDQANSYSITLNMVDSNGNSGNTTYLLASHTVTSLGKGQASAVLPAESVIPLLFGEETKNVGGTVSAVQYSNDADTSQWQLTTDRTNDQMFTNSRSSLFVQNQNNEWNGNHTLQNAGIGLAAPSSISDEVRGMLLLDDDLEKDRIDFDDFLDSITNENINLYTSGNSPLPLFDSEYQPFDEILLPLL